ncbi:MAG: DUF3800 domain-containing protein [Propionibacteriaceae bacterium]|nr:DUF3800 domain-containing protein [Propionibacteriaceae bacterium]
MSELSIFIDESGDFGDSGSGYYVVVFVFHDQRHGIDSHLARLSQSLADIGLPGNHAVHTGAAIRGEAEYRGLPIETRKAAFTRLFAFARSAGVTYKAFTFRKREHKGRLKLKGSISRSLALFLRENAEFFLSFDKVIAYYDNGQAEITDIMNTLFNAFFFDVEFRRVAPSQYRLFQVADLFCTLELLRAKADDGSLSRADMFFFTSPRTLKKDYLNKVGAMRFERTLG